MMVISDHDCDNDNDGDGDSTGDGISSYTICFILH